MTRARLMVLVFFFLAVSVVLSAIVYRERRDASSVTPTFAVTTKATDIPIAQTTPTTDNTTARSVMTTQPTNAASPTRIAAPASLIIPVAGVRKEQLRDTFNEARSENRVHDAIDIPAPHQTPVRAAAAGKIFRLFQSERGGTTIYQTSADERFVFYYAHLDRYADNLAEGHVARQGEVVGYVGDTGNAGPGNYHLHFAIWIVTDPKRLWEGENINPYPLLNK